MALIYVWLRLSTMKQAGLAPRVELPEQGHRARAEDHRAAHGRQGSPLSFRLHAGYFAVARPVAVAGKRV